MKQTGRVTHKVEQRYPADRVGVGGFKGGNTMNIDSWNLRSRRHLKRKSTVEIEQRTFTACGSAK